MQCSCVTKTGTNKPRLCVCAASLFCLFGWSLRPLNPLKALASCFYLESVFLQVLRSGLCLSLEFGARKDNFRCQRTNITVINRETRFEKQWKFTWVCKSLKCFSVNIQWKSSIFVPISTSCVSGEAKGSFTGNNSFHWNDIFPPCGHYWNVEHELFIPLTPNFLLLVVIINSS